MVKRNAREDLAMDLTCGDGFVKAPPPRRKCRLSTLRLSGSRAGCFASAAELSTSSITAMLATTRP
jgi:hypothetical protein